ncbi:MAG TPA: hypothetical protein VMT76_08380 [Puia sp.]|nr:hypothetical protein [Puia sp.]
MWKFFCQEGQGHPGAWPSVMGDNIDEYYNSIKDKSVIIISFPESKPWHMREMLVQDTDGYIIRFGNRMDCD